VQDKAPEIFHYFQIKTVLHLRQPPQEPNQRFHGGLAGSYVHKTGEEDGKRLNINVIKP
jgi:hypothetical protein